MFCSLIKGVTLKIRMLYFVAINSVLLNLLCVCTISVQTHSGADSVALGTVFPSPPQSGDLGPSGQDFSEDLVTWCYPVNQYGYIGAISKDNSANEQTSTASPADHECIGIETCEHSDTPGWLDRFNAVLFPKK